MVEPTFECYWLFWKKILLSFENSSIFPVVKIKKCQILICTPVFIAALFARTRAWNQSRCPMTDEWIKKKWYIYVMEYYSAIKRNEIESVVVRRMNLESVIQNEVSQKEKNKYWILTHIYIQNLEKWWERTCGHSGVGDGGTNWEGSTDIFKLSCAK